MTTEQQARNNRDTSDEKLMAVLEYFLLTKEEAERIYEAINDNQVEVADINEMLDQMQFTLNDL